MAQATNPKRGLQLYIFMHKALINDTGAIAKTTKDLGWVSQFEPRSSTSTAFSEGDEEEGSSTESILSFNVRFHGT